ncbi:MAG: hypothetical protein JW715_02825 [Sedimentisphaerales bacterium]|nr:hypothetical protein [Sedimentisphaerales bacterium]
MKLINQNSLASTLDAVNEALFYKQPLSKSEKVRVAKWIASRQGLPGSYADMFAPTKKDYRDGLTLFTGEKISTRAGLSHVLGQESCRALLLLKVTSADVKSALESASAGFIERMKQYIMADQGMYCCASCSCALWRHLASGGLESGEKILTAGMKTLASLRDGKGRWKRFPFYYTLLALSEIELPSARKEMQYAARACERLLKRQAKTDKIGKRRRILAEKILEKC